MTHPTGLVAINGTIIAACHDIKARRIWFCVRHSRVSVCGSAAAGRELPVRAQLQRVCDRGRWAAWALARRLDCLETDRSLSPRRSRGL